MDHGDNSPERIQHDTPRFSPWAGGQNSQSCHGHDDAYNDDIHHVTGTLPRGPATDSERHWNRAWLQHLMEQTGELNQQFDIERNQLLSGELAAHQEAQGIQHESTALLGQIAKVIHDLSSIRSESLGAHEMALQKCAEVKTSLAAIRKSMVSCMDVAGFRAELAFIAREIQMFRSSVERDQMIVRSDMETLSNAKASLDSEVAQLVGHVWTVKTQIQNMRMAEMVRQRRVQEQQREVQAVGVVGKAWGELASVKARTDMLVGEFQRLLTRLHNVGVVAPKRELYVKEERPPVGTIELGEECFSARLLIRLGFLKARGWEAYISDDDEALEEHVLRTGHVAGLQEPEIAEDDPAYIQVTSGWLCICVLTFAVKVLIILAMFKNGGLAMADDCLMEPLCHSSWLVLHASKAFAVCVAGMHLAKDLMNILNYWMVSELLEAKRNMEVTISAIFRGLLTVLIAVTNVVMYRYMTSPANVWINMTALAFINNLGRYVVAVTKSGVFGHHLSKTLTTLNFQLTLISMYPAWFAWARSATLTFCLGAISMMGLVIFLLPDNMCNAS